MAGALAPPRADPAIAGFNPAEVAITMTNTAHITRIALSPASLDMSMAVERHGRTPIKTAMSMFRCIAGLCLAATLLAQPARAQDIAEAAPPIAVDPAVGDYTSTQMELAAGLRLNRDGTFEYGLTVGSLDERARGRWTRVGDRIELVSDPRPVAPTITASRVEQGPDNAFAIRLVAPNGRDIPGIDLRVDLDTGQALESYVAGAPWTLPADETRRPRFVTFSKESYRIDSGPLPLRADAGTVAIFLLTPNDFGVADLTGAYLEPRGDSLALRRPEGTILFTRAIASD